MYSSGPSELGQQSLKCPTRGLEPHMQRTCDLRICSCAESTVLIQSTTVDVPSSELGLSHPLSRQRVRPSPRNQRGGGAHTRLRVRESRFRRLEKKLSILSTLCSCALLCAEQGEGRLADYGHLTMYLFYRVPYNILRYDAFRSFLSPLFTHAVFTIVIRFVMLKQVRIIR